MARVFSLKDLQLLDASGKSPRFHLDYDKLGCIVDLPGRYEYIAATMVENRRLGSVDGYVSVRSKFFLPTSTNYLSLRTRWVRVELSDRYRAKQDAHQLAASMTMEAIESVERSGSEIYTGDHGAKSWPTLVHELISSLLTGEKMRSEHLYDEMVGPYANLGQFSEMPSPPAFPGFAYALALSDYEAFQKHVHSQVATIESMIKSEKLRPFG